MNSQSDRLPEDSATPPDEGDARIVQGRAHWWSLHALRFYAIHLVAGAGVFWVGFSWSGLLLAVGMYVARMFFLTAGYHRYFSHRTFRTSRVGQFLLALGGTLCVQKGVLWWASRHRIHHLHSDDPLDPHSPRQRGFWESHMGWILTREHSDTAWSRVRDLAGYSELRWLNQYYLVPCVALAFVLLFVGGLWAVVWGFFVSTVLLWHGTFTINSLSHVFGTRPYKTGDDSRNNFLLAIITLGEGWHNNHHHYQSAANQGFRWWQFDPTFYVLIGLEKLGVIWDLRRAPRQVVGAVQTDGTPGSTAVRATPPAIPEV